MPRRCSPGLGQTTFGWTHVRQSHSTHCAATDFSEWAEAPRVSHPLTSWHHSWVPPLPATAMVQHGLLDPKRGILHSNSPNYSLECQSPFKWTPGSKIMLSRVCEAIKAHSKSKNRRNSCTEPGTFKCPSVKLYWTRFPFCPWYKLAAPHISSC